MTAVVYREYTLLCDAELPGAERCKNFYGPFGVERTPAELRKLAAADGWTHQRGPRSRDRARRASRDLCPQHKPEQEADR